MKTLIALVVVLAVAGGGMAWYWREAGNHQAAFRTAVVKRGELLATVSATGTVEPEEVVDVGAQVGGMIQEFGRDPRDATKPIDYRSEVEQGTVLARIDDALYQARLDRAKGQVGQAQAEVEQAGADLMHAEADLAQLNAKERQAERDWGRAQKLKPTKAISDLDYDNAQAAYEVAKANVAVGQAAISQAKAGKLRAEKTLAAAQADLREAQKNVEYTIIRSPVKGVIIDRRVNVGQTVVASLNAPSLFLIAKDLKRVQVWASVNEADIGQIHPGQPVRFTVDAYPGATFRGEVLQVRLNAQMTQNVVTYTVVVVADNSSGKLLPYLTANVQFEVDRRSDVLLVPNAALRWQPRPEQIAPEARGAAAAAAGSRGPGGADSAATGAPERHHRGIVWAQDQGWLRPIDVQTGVTNGVVTEIVKGDVREETAVVVGEARPEQAGNTATNPFLPQMFRGTSKAQ